MILLVCPNCERHIGSVQTQMTIVATGWIRIVSGRDSGVEQAVAPPMRRMSTAPTHIVPAETFICPRCHKEAAVEKWKYVVMCDQCEKPLAGVLDDPTELVDLSICRDVRSIYCIECWHRIGRDYCDVCRCNPECELRTQ